MLNKITQNRTQYYRFSILCLMLLVITIFLLSANTYVSPTQTALKTTLKQDTTILINGVSFDLVFVKGGTFVMGCQEGRDTNCNNDEKPTRNIKLSNFYIGKYEITQKQWEAIMGKIPNHSKPCTDCPVEFISWKDVQSFIEKINQLTALQFALPTEAQWEYAARGGEKSKAYQYAGSNDIDKVAWYFSNADKKTQPVGQKEPNELGIYDMTGNVAEWCADSYAPYGKDQNTHNPKVSQEGADYIVRGGGRNSYPAKCRITNRSKKIMAAKFPSLGFRISLAAQ
ncbi:MAG: SUMF1/EgtB/PvdO family nonheme iron enzyme [Bernardetiaceae bacterium]|nr:SUMF1/EgtB/PvdO family nonheme iron enzyme [Bernardetiaceae bacterium]